MKILLINPPDDLGSFLGRGKNFVPAFEPLGLLYISSVCKQRGHEVFVVDAFREELSLQQIKNTIVKMQPDVLGCTSFVSNGNVIYELGKWIKNEYPEIMVIFGNVHASVYAEAYLRNKCCDIVVHGEGEYTFSKIVETIEKKKNDFSVIPSISYLIDGKFITTCEHVVVEDISQLPLPDRDAVRQELYNLSSISNMPYAGKKNSVGKHMFASRGCPFSCTFCVVHNKRKQRCNSISNVVNEMEVLINKYRANYIFIMDPIFIANKQWVIGICKEIKRRGLDFKWGCEGHVNFIDQELVVEMESAGCYDMAFGIESGVQHILDNIQKGTRLDRIEESVKIVKKSTKIKVSGLFILGLPRETYRDIVQTINFAKRLPLDMAQFSVLSPYPGSPIFYELREKGEIDTGLREDGTLDTSVWLRYSAYISFTHNEPIWVTPGLTAHALKKLQKKALREFYFRPKQFFTQLRRVHPYQAWTMILTFLKTFF
ncbi:MAG: radical SAM protein [Candidatus Omnitrophica bacterium]|nr:radical SAM protein [Candidatus Omnitrophota bacterium]